MFKLSHRPPNPTIVDIRKKGKSWCDSEERPPKLLPDELIETGDIDTLNGVVLDTYTIRSNGFRVQDLIKEI